MANSAWQGTIQNSTGDIVVGAEISVYDEGTGTLATIFSDIGGAALSNPFFSDSNGFAQFYAGAGQYRITATESGSGLSQTWRHVRLGSGGSTDTGTASDEVPLNSDLADVLRDSDIGQTVAGLSSPGATNWDGGNLLNTAPVPVNVNSGTTYTLPAGGSWDYWLQGFSAGQLMAGSCVSGRAAGGSEVYNNPGAVFIRGWAKRIL